MENKSDNSKSGIGFLGVLQIAFIVLKLCRVINWSWFWVLAPTWVSLTLIVICTVIMIGMRRRRK